MENAEKQLFLNLQNLKTIFLRQKNVKFEQKILGLITTYTIVPQWCLLMNLHLSQGRFSEESISPSVVFSIYSIIYISWSKGIEGILYLPRLVGDLMSSKDSESKWS